MCSRFENKETGESMFKKFEKDFLLLNIAAKDLKQINIAPKDDILVIQKNDKEFILEHFSWGIKFSGEKTPLIFNSRIETISSKPYWKNLFRGSRCIIPATAFYEWITIDGIKIPHRISFSNLSVFYFAGIYIKIGNGIFASIITTSANSEIAKIHNRMPVIFKKEEGINFLRTNEKSALEMCVPFNDSEPVNIETANDILTLKQKDILKGK